MGSESMESFSTSLCRLLAQEESACRTLLETVQEERKAIRALAVAEFPGINSKRLAVLEQLQTLAHERDLLLRRFAETDVAGPVSIPLQRIVESLTDPRSGELREQYQRVMAAAKLVRGEIKQNAVLIEGIRDFIDNALSAGSKAAPGLDLYNGGGRNAGARPAAVIHHRG
jgi:FlgN protein